MTAKDHGIDKIIFLAILVMPYRPLIKLALGHLRWHLGLIEICGI